MHSSQVPAGASLVRIERGLAGSPFRLSSSATNLIGRRVPGSERRLVDLGSDRSVSRRHARIFRSDGAWWVEDLGSAAGTLLDATPLAPGRPETILPGAVLRVAGHELVFVPNGNLFARLGNLDVLVEAVPAVALGSLLAGFGPIRRVRVRHHADVTRDESRLSIRLGSIWSADVRLPALVPGELSEFLRPPGKNHFDGWWNVHSPMDVGLAVFDPNSTEGVVELGPEHVRVLPWDHWLHAPDQALALVPFILPADERIAAVAAELAVGLSVEQSPAETAEAVFDHLGQDWAISYRHEPGGGAEGAQRIRLSDEVFTDPIGRRGAGTCIDLALATASILEALGARPVVAIVGPPGGRHALVGCRTDEQTAVAAGAEVATRSGVWFDPNGLTRDPAWRCGFGEARARATDALRAGPLLAAVDVVAARALGVRSLPVPTRARWTKSASEVVTTATRLSADCGCRLETTVLLAALLTWCEAQHPEVFRNAGFSGAGKRIAERLRSSEHRRDGSVNYRTVLARADAIATTRVPATVDVAILAIALLAAPSAALDRALEFVNLHRSSLRALVISLEGQSAPEDDDTSRF